jgi:hypothetical protein
LIFYDISGNGMHLYGTRKNAGCGSVAPSDSEEADKGTRGRRSAIGSGADILPILEIFPPFEIVINIAGDL